MNEETKAVVTVSEMARMVGLSRARFYQLQKMGVFPQPVYDKGRPVYTEEQQQVCLEVRRRNRGIDGRPVLFHARRRGTEPARRSPRASKPIPKNKDVAALLDGLNALGLTTATAAQVVKVTAELFPKGTACPVCGAKPWRIRAIMFSTASRSQRARHPFSTITSATTTSRQKPAVPSSRTCASSPPGSPAQTRSRSGTTCAGRRRQRTIKEAIEDLLIKERLGLTPRLRELDARVERVELELRQLIAGALGDEPWPRTLPVPID